MNKKSSKIDITNDLIIKYKDYLRPEIKTISIVHSDGNVWLETLSIVIIKDKGWTKETVNLIDLDIINNDYIDMFNFADNIEDNAGKFIELSLYSLINSTNLFTEQAIEMLNKKNNVFGIDD